MPNIYLRLPTSRCQFFRHRDPKLTLAKDEPIVFSNYSHEHFIMRNSLINAPARSSHIDLGCFSQQQWCNMLSGRHPAGGKVVMRRDAGSWLTFQEVQQLNGRLTDGKGAHDDYLCIRLPSEVEVVDTVYAVKPTFTLDTHGIRALVVSLNNDFKRSLVEWALSTFDFCTAKGKVIARSHNAMLERYLMRYGIEASEEEKDVLRRIIGRWFRTEHCFFKSYSCVDMQYKDSRDKPNRIDEVQWL